jgi:hypothetical protein
MTGMTGMTSTTGMTGMTRMTSMAIIPPCRFSLTSSGWPTVGSGEWPG